MACKTKTKKYGVGGSIGSGLGAGVGGILGTFLMPGLGTAGGAAIGGALGGAIGTGIESGIQNNRDKYKGTLSANQTIIPQNDMTMYNTGLNPYGNSYGYAFGGPLMTQYKGMTHENGGIVLGQTNNEVEDGEVRMGEYIFSNRLTPKGSKITYADLAKQIEKKYSKRKGDSIDNETMKRELSQLARSQESDRKMQEAMQMQQQGQMQQQYAMGGFMPEGDPESKPPKRESMSGGIGSENTSSRDKKRGVSLKLDDAQLSTKPLKWKLGLSGQQDATGDMFYNNASPLGKMRNQIDNTRDFNKANRLKKSVYQDEIANANEYAQYLQNEINAGNLQTIPQSDLDAFVNTTNTMKRQQSRFPYKKEKKNYAEPKSLDDQTKRLQYFENLNSQKVEGYKPFSQYNSQFANGGTISPDDPPWKFTDLIQKPYAEGAGNMNNWVNTEEVKDASKYNNSWLDKQMMAPGLYSGYSSSFNGLPNTYSAFNVNAKIPLFSKGQQKPEISIRPAYAYTPSFMGKHFGNNYMPNLLKPGYDRFYLMGKPNNMLPSEKNKMIDANVNKNLENLRGQGTKKFAMGGEPDIPPYGNRTNPYLNNNNPYGYETDLNATNEKFDDGMMAINPINIKPVNVNGRNLSKGLAKYKVSGELPTTLPKIPYNGNNNTNNSTNNNTNNFSETIKNAKDKLGNIDWEKLKSKIPNINWDKVKSDNPNISGNDLLKTGLSTLGGLYDIARGINGANYESYGRIPNMQLKQLDPTEAIRQQREIGNTAMNNVKNIGGQGLGQYLNNINSIGAGTQRNTGNIINQYDNANIGLSNQERQMNNQIKQQNIALDMQQNDINARERDNASNDIQKGLTTLGQGFNQMYQDKNAQAAQDMILKQWIGSNDYKPLNVNGQWILTNRTTGPDGKVYHFDAMGNVYDINGNLLGTKDDYLNGFMFQSKDKNGNDVSYNPYAKSFGKLN